MVLGIGGDGEGLTVAIKARTRDFTEGVSDARDKAVELAGGLQLLQGRANEAASELDDTKRSALFASGAFTALTLSTEGAALSFGALGSSVATVLGGMMVLSTMLFPLAATFGVMAFAVGSLALALGAVPLLGVIGHTRELKVALKKVKGEVLALTKPLRDKFFQVLLQIIHDLPELTKHILSAADGGDKFGDMFLKLWNIAKRVIPKLARFVTRLAKKAFPHLVNVIKWLEKHGPAIWREMKKTAKEVLPILKDLFKTVAKNLPVWIEFGINVMQLVDGPLKFLINSLTGLATAFNKAFNAGQRFFDMIDKRGGPVLPQTWSGNQPKNARDKAMGTIVNVQSINASSKQGGRQAAQGLIEELRSHGLP